MQFDEQGQKSKGQCQPDGACRKMPTNRSRKALCRRSASTNSRFFFKKRDAKTEQIIYGLSPNPLREEENNEESLSENGADFDAQPLPIQPPDVNGDLIVDDSDDQILSEDSFQEVGGWAYFTAQA